MKSITRGTTKAHDCAIITLSDDGCINPLREQTNKQINELSYQIHEIVVHEMVYTSSLSLVVGFENYYYLVVVVLVVRVEVLVLFVDVVMIFVPIIARDGIVLLVIGT
jgi:hypothetical protein